MGDKTVKLHLQNHRCGTSDSHAPFTTSTPETDSHQYFIECSECSSSCWNFLTGRHFGHVDNNGTQFYLMMNSLPEFPGDPQL